MPLTMSQIMYHFDILWSELVVSIGAIVLLWQQRLFPRPEGRAIACAGLRTPDGSADRLSGVRSTFKPTASRRIAVRGAWPETVPRAHRPAAGWNTPRPSPNVGCVGCRSSRIPSFCSFGAACRNAINAHRQQLVRTFAGHVPCLLTDLCHRGIYLQ